MIFPNTKCLHEGSATVLKFGEDCFRGMCGTCRMVGPIADTAYMAGFKFWGITHDKNTEKCTASRAELLRSTSVPSAFGAPVGPSLTAAHLNQMYNQIQEALVATAPNPKPYFIVVSSEGHAAIPIQHSTLQVAQTEADRLTKIKPGVTFTVFESKSSVFTPKADTKKTVYETPVQYSYTTPFYSFGLGGRL